MTDLNKKGMAVELLLFAVIGIIAIVFFAGLMYGVNLLSVELLDIQGDEYNNGTNVSWAAGSTLSYVNNGMENLKIVAFSLIFGFMIASWIVAFYARNHPVMYIVYFLIFLMLIVLGAYISNAYENLQTSDIFENKISEFGASNFVMNHLAAWITFVGFIGLIIMIVGRYIES